MFPLDVFRVSRVKMGFLGFCKGEEITESCAGSFKQSSSHDGRELPWESSGSCQFGKDGKR